jgi:peptidoglycan-associated lipoprotein
MTRFFYTIACAIALPGAFFLAGCAKKVAAVNPAPAAPVATAPATVDRAGSTPIPQNANQPALTSSNRAGNMPDQATRDRIQALLNRIQDAYFDYNTAIIRTDGVATLKADAQTLSEILRQYPDYKLTIQGYCDERGSAEYNLALGDSRARHAKEFLVEIGVPATQLLTVSYGKEQQICSEHDENCWQKNRRIHITQAQNGVRG